MPRPTAERIVAKIGAYAVDPASQANNVKALKGENAIRLRVGEWRVIMLDGAVLDIVRIAARGSAHD
jgi:mRNA interferase RelE/StbE